MQYIIVGAGFWGATIAERIASVMKQPVMVIDSATISAVIATLHWMRKRALSATVMVRIFFIPRCHKCGSISIGSGNSLATSTRCSSPMRARFIPCLSI